MGCTNRTSESTEPEELIIQHVSKRYRPKNGKDALDHLKRGIAIEVLDTHAFQCAAILHEHGHFNFSFKLSRWNKDWTGFTTPSVNDY